MPKPRTWVSREAISRSVECSIAMVLLVVFAAPPVQGQYSSYRPARRSVMAARPSGSGPSSAIAHNLEVGLDGGGAFTSPTSKSFESLSGGTASAGRWSARRNSKSTATNNLAYNTYIKSQTVRQSGGNFYASAAGFGTGGGSISQFRSLIGPAMRSRSSLLSNIDTAARQGQSFYGVPANQLSRLRTPAQMGWVLPEVVSSRTVPGGEIEVPAKADVSPSPDGSEQQPDRQTEGKLATVRISPEELAKNRLASRQRDYVDQAWEEFRKGEYQQAKSYFMLADAASMSDPVGRPLVKLSLAYTSIAAQEYVLAANALRWLLTPDAVTGEVPDPLVLNRIQDLGQRYGQRNDYVNQQERLELFAAQQGAAPEVRALQALAAWGRGDHTNALFIANQLSGETEFGDWSRLASLMRRAEQGADSAGTAISTSQPAAGGN